jgi:hypothetical protein
MASGTAEVFATPADVEVALREPARNAAFSGVAWAKSRGFPPRAEEFVRTRLTVAGPGARSSSPPGGWG